LIVGKIWLWRNTQKNYIITLFWAFSITSAPTARASPCISITSQKANKVANGGQEDTPLGLPPPLGERGGYPHSCRRELPNDGKKRVSTELKKLKKYRTKERKSFKTALAAISRQIVAFAESLDTGIKFEKLFSTRYSQRESPSHPFEFSFEDGSFFTLQKMVEKRAHNRGIPVMYVNPAYTSRLCSRCGAFGRRTRKRFECPHCGYVAHADVNAAFNSASGPLNNTGNECITEQEEALAFLLSKVTDAQARKGSSPARAGATHHAVTHAHAYSNKGKPARGAGTSTTFFPCRRSG
jgi:IS605 OrfB family transposase